MLRVKPGICISPFSLLYCVTHFSSSQKQSKTHYEILGLQRNATKKDIKTAFISLSKQYHPDVNPDDKSNFLTINEAYSTLADPVQREQYDLKLRTIEAYHYSVRNGGYAGSTGYTGSQPWYRQGIKYSQYNTREAYMFTNRQYGFEERFGMHRKPNHGRVIKYLVLMMFLATCIHSFRIHWTHKEFLKHSEEENERNYLVYNEVRERAKTTTLQEQLATLTKRHSETLKKLTESGK